MMSQKKNNAIVFRPTTMAQLTGLEAFDCDGDTTTLGSRWEKWKRALENYLIAAGIDNTIKKRAILLHLAGLAL